MLYSGRVGTAAALDVLVAGGPVAVVSTPSRQLPAGALVVWRITNVRKLGSFIRNARLARDQQVFTSTAIWLDCWVNSVVDVSVEG